MREQWMAMAAVSVALAGLAACGEVATVPHAAAAQADSVAVDGGSDLGPAGPADVAAATDVPAAAEVAAPPDAAAGSDVDPADAAGDALAPQDVPEQPDATAPDDAAAQPDVAAPQDVPAPVDVPETADVQADSAPEVATCVATVPATEACDGLDNDCNGQTDEAAQACEDGNVCTADSCQGSKACSHAPYAGVCDDGQACTTEACAAGICKAEAKVCDDKDSCTTDSCETATGACAVAPVANCKACAADGDCTDGKDCTTDKCVTGKCQNSAIANCYGPTDFQHSGMSLTSSTVELTSKLSWTVQVVNLGKKASAASMVAWLSADETIDAGDLQLLVDASANGPLGIGSGVDMKTLSYAKTPGNDLSGAHKFLCVQITTTALDPTPANNVGCTPIYVKLPDWHVTAVKPAKSTWFWNDVSYSTVVTIKNVGTAAPIAGYSAMLKLYLSADDKWDSKDVAYGASLDSGLLGAGVSKDFTVSAALASGTIDAKYLCARAAPLNVINEADMANNVVCIPHAFVTAGDIKLAPVIKANQASNPPTDPPGFTDGFSTLQTGQYGVTPACRMAYVSNKGDAAMKDYAVRCWIQTGAAGSASPTKLWEVQGIGALNLPPLAYSPPYQFPNAVFTGVPEGGLKLPAAPTPQPTPLTMCMAFNEDGKVTEKTLLDNQVCADILVTFVDLGWYNVVGPTGPAATTIQAGTSNKISATNIKNFGSAKTQGGTAKPMFVRLALSADDKYSADDVQLWQSTPVASLAANGVAQISSVAVGSTDVGFTIPAGTAAGAWFLVMKIDSTDVEVEPTEGNNGWSKAITVN